MADQEILRLYVTVNEAHLVHGFDSVDALQHDHADCFNRKSNAIERFGLLAVAIVEEFF